jgi:hypothetical protein
MNAKKQASAEILSPEGRMMRQPVIKTSRSQHPGKYLKGSLNKAPIDDINQLKTLKKIRLNARKRFMGHPNHLCRNREKDRTPQGNPKPEAGPQNCKS